MTHKRQLLSSCCMYISSHRAGYTCAIPSYSLICTCNLIVCSEVILPLPPPPRKCLLFKWVAILPLKWAVRIWEGRRYHKFLVFTVQALPFEPVVQPIKGTSYSLFEPLCLMGHFPLTLCGGIQTNHLPHILTNYHSLPNYHIPVLQAKAKHLHPLKWWPWAESRMCPLFPVLLIVNLC